MQEAGLNPQTTIVNPGQLLANRKVLEARANQCLELIGDLGEILDLQGRGFLKLDDSVISQLKAIPSFINELIAIAVCERSSESDFLPLAQEQLIKSGNEKINWLIEQEIQERVEAAKIAQRDQKTLQAAITAELKIGKKSNIERGDLDTKTPTALEGLSSGLNAADGVSLNNIASGEFSTIGLIERDGVRKGDFFITGISCVNSHGPERKVLDKSKLTKLTTNPLESNSYDDIQESNNGMNMRTLTLSTEESLKNLLVYKISDQVKFSIPIDPSVRPDDLIPLPTKLGYLINRINFQYPNNDQVSMEIELYKDPIGVTYIKGLNGKLLAGQDLKLEQVPYSFRPDKAKLGTEYLDLACKPSGIIKPGSALDRLLRIVDIGSRMNLIRAYLKYKGAIYYHNSQLQELLANCPNYAQAMAAAGFPGTCSHHQHIQELLFKEYDIPCFGIKGLVVVRNSSGQLAFQANMTHIKTAVIRNDGTIEEVEATKDLDWMGDSTQEETFFDPSLLDFSAYSELLDRKDITEEFIYDSIERLRAELNLEFDLKNCTIAPKSNYEAHRLMSFLELIDDLNSPETLKQLLDEIGIWGIVSQLNQASEIVIHDAPIDTENFYEDVKELFSLKTIGLKLYTFASEHSPDTIARLEDFSFLPASPEIPQTCTVDYWRHLKCRFKVEELNNDELAALDLAINSFKPEEAEEKFQFLMKILNYELSNFLSKELYGLKRTSLESIENSLQELLAKLKSTGHFDHLIEENSLGNFALTNSVIAFCEDKSRYFGINHYGSEELAKIRGIAILEALGFRNFDDPDMQSDIALDGIREGKFFKLDTDGKIIPESNPVLYIWMIANDQDQDELLALSRIKASGILKNQIADEDIDFDRKEFLSEIKLSNGLAAKFSNKLLTKLLNAGSGYFNPLAQAMIEILIKARSNDSEQATNLDRDPDLEECLFGVDSITDFVRFDEYDFIYDLVKERYGEYQEGIFRYICKNTDLQNQSEITKQIQLLEPELQELIPIAMTVLKDIGPGVFQVDLSKTVREALGLGYIQGLSSNRAFAVVSPAIDIIEDEKQDPILPRASETHQAVVAMLGKMKNYSLVNSKFDNGSLRLVPLTAGRTAHKAGTFYRGYAQGDDYGSIDWSVSSRLGMQTIYVRAADTVVDVDRRTPKDFIFDLALINEEGFENNPHLMALCNEISNALRTNQPLSLSVLCGPNILVAFSNKELREIFTDKKEFFPKEDTLGRRTKIEELLLQLALMSRNLKKHIPGIFETTKLYPETTTFLQKQMAQSQVVIISKNRERINELLKLNSRNSKPAHIALGSFKKV